MRFGLKEKIVLLMANLALLSCSGNLQEGQADRLYSILPPPPITGDPGWDFPTDPELNVPGLNLKTFLGGEHVHWGVHKIKWFLEPLDPKDEGLYSTKLEYSRDSGATWTTIVESVPSVGAKLMEYDWVVEQTANWEGTRYRIRVTTTNVYGIKYVKESLEDFTVDNTPPVLLARSLEINGRQSEEIPGQGWTKIEIERSYMNVSFKAEDSLSPVSDYCIKIGSSLPPSEFDDCWKILKNMDIEPAKSVVVKNAPAFVGFVATTSVLRLWVKDMAGNVSQIAGGGVYNKDYVGIVFNPAQPPEVTNVIVANVVNPSVPPTREQLVTGDKVNKIYIKWRIRPKGKGQLALQDGVKLEFTTDEENFQPITTDQIKDRDNSANGYCFSDGDLALYSGCYTWAGTTIPTTYFRVRVSATNDVGLVTAASSSPLNSGSFRNVAGNTDNGVGNSAESAIFSYTGGGDSHWSNPASFVVTRRGRIYVRDDRLGILAIDPADGVNRIFIKKGNPSLVVQPGEDTDVSNATTVPQRIALDYKDRLLILEKNRVRRVSENNIISTIIGIKPGPDGKLITGYERFKDNGLIAGEGKANWFEKKADGAYKHLTDEGCFSVYTTPGVPALFYDFQNTGALQFMWPLPNGDIYFSSANFWDRPVQSAVGAEPYFAIYRENDNKGNKVQRVYPFRLCGKGVHDGTKQDPYYPFDELRISSFPAINFNPYNSMVESFSLRIHKPISGGAIYYGATFNPRSGRSRGSNTIYPFPNYGGGFAHWGAPAYIPTRKGAINFAHYNAGGLKYNASYNQWEPIFRPWANGQCYDGTRSKDCYVDLLDIFVTEDNITYFFDRGRIRAIANNKVRTIFGQSRKYGDGEDPGSARLNMVEYLGVWGNDDRIVAYDTREFVAREIRQGISINKIMGSNGEGKCEYVDGEYSCTTGYYYWGSPNANIGNTFDNTNKVGSLNMDASWWGIHYWDWSTGFMVDRDNGDIYSYSGGGPFHGIARYFINPNYNGLGIAKRQAQMILGHYDWDSKSYFLTKGANSCDGKSAMGCLIQSSPDSGNGLFAGGAYAVVVPAMGIDNVTKKKTIIATTHDWGYDHTDERSQWIGSHKHCYLKAVRLPTVPAQGGAIPGGADLKSSLVQHVMGTDDRCVGYGGNGEALPADGTVMTSNSNFPSWHSTSIPHRFIEPNDSNSLNGDDGMLMSWRGSNRIVQVNFARSSLNGQDDVITGSTATVTAAQLPRAILGFNYRVKLGVGRQFFYCGTDGLLYKFAGGIETNLPLPAGSGISCHNRGKSIEWNKAKNAFYFVYTQNGMTGIGEYYVGN